MWKYENHFESLVKKLAKREGKGQLFPPYLSAQSQMCKRESVFLIVLKKEKNPSPSEVMDVAVQMETTPLSEWDSHRGLLPDIRLVRTSAVSAVCCLLWFRSSLLSPLSLLSLSLRGGGGRGV
jgi:hypothetical protein